MKIDLVIDCFGYGKVYERNGNNMTYAEAFAKIKKKLEKADVKGFDKDFAIQVTIADEDAAGTFYVAYIGGEFSVEPYDYRDNSVAIDITTADFIKLVEGKLTAEKAVADEKLFTFGDESVLGYITGIAKPATRKKAAEKKPAEKKAPAKKADAEKKEPAKKAAEKPAEEKKAPAKKVAEKPVEEKKASAKKTAEKPVEEKKAPAKKTTTKEAKAEEKAPAKKADK